MECIRCHVREATKNCYQCHKAMCDTCSFTDENGTFCGRECAAKYREFRDHSKEDKRRVGVGPVGKLIGLIIIAAVVLGALYALGVFKKSDVKKMMNKGKSAVKEVTEKARGAMDKVEK